MAQSMEMNDLHQANFRLCRLCLWSNYDGLGFYLENTSIPPHMIRIVESNSPAAAGGLRMLDLILAVNNEDVSTADYITVTETIKNARDSNSRIELLVIEKCFYREFKSQDYSFNPRLARTIETPTAMPRDYMNFPKYTPRICEIHLSKTDQSFGFEVTDDIKNIGVFIQEVIPNTPASRTTLRKSDRILEIDDRFVDKQASKFIYEKLYKAKKKRTVKLYVVDTDTYKYFQENRISLKSKNFRKSKFAKHKQPSTYTNDVDISTESRSADIDDMSHEDDIRLCTIIRTSPTDRFGIELSYHRRYQYHFLILKPGHDSVLSIRAGVKTDDRLIEVNGENIEDFDHDKVQECIHAIKYPQVLQLLVADTATYNYYKQQNKVIHSGLPSVQKLPKNIVKEPSSSKTELVNSKPRISIENSQSNRRNYKLFCIPNFQGYGFRVNSNEEGRIAHKISQIAPHSPAAQQGLRVGDYILSVNNKNVERMNRSDFDQLIRTSVQNAETHKNPLLLQVINEDCYKHSTILDDVSTRHSATDPPSKSTINQPYMNDHSSTPRETVDVVSKNRLPHSSRLNVESDQPSGSQLKTANTRILTDTNHREKPIENQRVHNNVSNKQSDLKRGDGSIERSRKRRTSVNKENDVVNYSDDRNADSNYKQKPTTIRRPSLSESKTSNNGINLVPSDPIAFEASLCRKRQQAIDNMSYRQAINSWRARRLQDVVELIIDLSKGKSLIDRAWIVFYWITQNIEYDVEAYFSGNIRHQTAEDVFASGKGVCEAFATIFESLCTAVQIECKKISGYAKGHGFKMEQNSFARTNHAWNVIRLTGHWYLVDSTWGEGFLDTNNRNQKKLNPFYFLVRPEQMIYRHFPENPTWQLLMSPISMDDFFRLPYVAPIFFEHNLDIISPRYSNTASFNSNLGLAEVIVQAPSDIVLMGSIEQKGSGKIKNGCFVQYDTSRQQWQCLFAPQQGGFHTLTLFVRREKQVIEDKTDEKKYSQAIQFGLNVPTGITRTKTFPLTYGLFTERKCQIFEPLDGALKSGSIVTIHCRIPGAHYARLLLDENWLPEDLVKDEIFKRQITVPQKKITMYVKFLDKQYNSNYDGLFYYSVK